MSKTDAGSKAGAGAPEGGKSNTPQDETDAARRSGQLGSDKPGTDKAAAPARGADKTPHPDGPEYEEGGQYPGTRKPGGRS